MKSLRLVALLLLAVFAPMPALKAAEKQPAATYHARRVALGAKLHGGVAVLFAAERPALDMAPYRQDEDFYYLTGWSEPGAALMIVGDSSQAQTGRDQTGGAQPAAPARAYQEILFLPSRDLRMEKFTGVKLGAATPGAPQTAGVDAVQWMSELPAVLNKLMDGDRRLMKNVWTQPEAPQAKALLNFAAVTFGLDSSVMAPHDVTEPTAQLRVVKDAGEIELLKKASAASMDGQRVMMRAVKPGVTEKAIVGKMTAAWMEGGCERPAYAAIVGSGPNSTTLHYSDSLRTMEDGDMVVVDAACEYSMYASDITRTVPANGHFTARQREIYNIVLGAQQAAINAFVAGKSKINDFSHHDPDSLDTVAYNYVNTHGKDLHGKPLSLYWLHGLGHMVGIGVHDPAEYPAVLKPGMVFTIEPGIYIPEEKIGVRIECDFVVGADGKITDLDGALPHTAEDVEAAMRGK